MVEPPELRSNPLDLGSKQKNRGDDENGGRSNLTRLRSLRDRSGFVVELEEPLSFRSNSVRPDVGRSARPRGAPLARERELLVELEEHLSNQLFETLADWNQQLTAENIDYSELST